MNDMVFTNGIVRNIVHNTGATVETVEKALIGAGFQKSGENASKAYQFCKGLMDKAVLQHMTGSIKAGDQDAMACVFGAGLKAEALSGMTVTVAKTRKPRK